MKTMTCTICGFMTETEWEFALHKAGDRHKRMLLVYEQGIEAGNYQSQSEIARLTAQLAELTAANARLEADRTLADMAWIDNQAALKLLTEENAKLRAMLEMEE